MNPAGRTFLVECYAPGIKQADVELAADRARGVAGSLVAGGRQLRYLGALLVAADDVVFHAFEADGPDVVTVASEAAGLSFTRIVESVSVLADPLVAPLEALFAGLRTSSRHTPEQ